MADTPNRDDTQSAEDLARDVLITRVVDGEASSADWKTLAGLAATDQRVWAELAEQQQAHDELCRAVEIATAPADSVELSDLDDHLSAPNSMERRLRAVGTWGGWAAAAAVALLWTTGLNPTEPMAGDMGEQAGLVRIGDSPEDAFDRYLAAGRADGTVVAEIPDRVVRSVRPLESGQVEVTYVRQVIERRTVDETYRRAMDEFGRTVEVPVPVAPAPPAAAAAPRAPRAF
ncbi:MAG: hypothetical protein RIB60_00295 [Phycisphaerales bacterium]